jgi:aspartate 1-decarboxylase
MNRTFLRAKLHRATITAADRDYEGSISLGRELCRVAGLLEFEQVDVYDITNAARFTTYVIYGEPGAVQVNGAAAALVSVGDHIIVAAYGSLTEAEIAAHRATVVLLGELNQVKAVNALPVSAP